MNFVALLDTGWTGLMASSNTAFHCFCLPSAHLCRIRHSATVTLYHNTIILLFRGAANINQLNHCANIGVLAAGIVNVLVSHKLSLGYWWYLENSDFSSHFHSAAVFFSPPQSFRVSQVWQPVYLLEGDVTDAPLEVGAAPPADVVHNAVHSLAAVPYPSLTASHSYHIVVARPHLVSTKPD
jgi:hypothetical protein